jgi:diguanylate cyclase (GGDEF)-like protein/PAS domain S-box-containing protein
MLHWLRLLRVLFTTMALYGGGTVHALEAAQAPQVVRLGVLAIQSKADTSAQWVPTAQALSRRLPGYRFEVLALNYEELNIAVKEKQVDFVLTNPERYVVLRNVFFLRPIVTINMSLEGRVFNQFGSVIFTRQDLPTIKTLHDVKNKSVAAVGLYSLGGFLIAADTLLQAHVNVRSSDVHELKFVGMPHSTVVERVMAGDADVGIVRTGVLEQMARQGKLNLSSVRVLNAQSSADFPQALSTELYPEWLWAALPQTPDKLVKSVALELLNVRSESLEAQAGRYHSFSPPANYAPVEMLMRRLKAYPSVEVEPLWEELWDAYSTPIQLGSLCALFIVLGLSAYLWRKNHHLKRITELYGVAQNGLQITSAAFQSQVGLIVTDGATRIVRANQAFCDMLGYTETDLVGKTTAELRGNDTAAGVTTSAWEQLHTNGQWQGELNIRNHAGQDLPCQVTITVIQNESAGVTGFVGSFVDMTEQKQTESEIRTLAFFDTLTGLPNRRLFLGRLATEMAKCFRTQQIGAVLFIDLDHFKLLNDSHGHTVGDELLQLIAKRLDHLGTEQNMAARLGGDEFVILLSALGPDPSQAMSQAMAFAETVREAILASYQLNADAPLGSDAQVLRYNCSGSVGVALFGLEEEPITEVLKRADVAMYQAKQAGRNAIRPYDSTAQTWLKERLALTVDLENALANHQLLLHYQLQIFANGQAAGAECLLRWNHPVQGSIPPVEFIPLAEESGVIVAVGEWVLQTACETLAQWARVPALERLTLSVNVSPRQFIEADFVPRLQNILQRSGARPARLVLEITEGIMLTNTAQVIEKMHQLRSLGLQFSIDDFGTGYSSLSYLHALPLREIKIDRAFVNDLLENTGSEAIVRAIIAMGDSLHLQVVSEGVETPSQMDKLITMGCKLLQGYWIGHPTDLANFERLLARPPAV